MSQSLQTAIQQIYASIAKGLIGVNFDPLKSYILTGCNNSGSGSSYVISQGAIFMNSQVYIVDATSFTTGGGETAVCKVDKKSYRQYGVDNATGEYGISLPDHPIPIIRIYSAVSGSGDIDFSDLESINSSIGGMGTGMANHVTIWNDANSIKSGVATEDANGNWIFGSTIPSRNLRWDAQNSVLSTDTQVKVSFNRTSGTKLGDFESVGISNFPGNGGAQNFVQINADTQKVTVLQENGTTQAVKIDGTSSSSVSIDTNKPVVFGRYTVANLPTGVTGATAFATDGRDYLEGVGAGTGVPVYWKINAWHVYYTNAVVVA